jgi:hypothetical protein
MIRVSGLIAGGGIDFLLACTELVLGTIQHPI